MDIKELITGTFEDYWARFDNALEGLTSAELAWQPQADCNPISFIAWHMARVEDRFVHHFARGAEDVWVRNDWWTQFGLGVADHGVRFTLEQVAAFPALSPEMLLGYIKDVRSETQAFLQELQLQDLDVVSGRFPFPPNIPAGADTWRMGHMFRQLFGELNQHLGQVSYLRGMLRGANSQRRLHTPA
jgi:hypothetical protein